MNISQKIFGIITYTSLGTVLGISLMAFITNKRFELMEKDTIMSSKISFLRGCTSVHTLETCKKHPGYTETEEIFSNIEKTLSPNFLTEYSKENLPPSNNGKIELKLNPQDSNFIQKALEGRGPRELML